MRTTKCEKKAFPFWNVDTEGNIPTSFVQLDRTLLTSKRFLELSPSQRCTYIAMICVCQGHREFRFAENVAKQYGFAPSTLRRNVNALIEAGFVKRKRSGQNTREPNIYEFCADWRSREGGGKRTPKEKSKKPKKKLKEKCCMRRILCVHWESGE